MRDRKQLLQIDLDKLKKEIIIKFKPSFNNLNDINIRKDIDKLSLNKYSIKDKIEIAKRILFVI